MKPRPYWELDVTGWRYTRRWRIGVRRGEWWIGARRNLSCDQTEYGLLGLTVAVPNDGTRRRPIPLPATVYLVDSPNSGLYDYCRRCKDTNFDSETRICITCTFGWDAGWQAEAAIEALAGKPGGEPR